MPTPNSGHFAAMIPRWEPVRRMRRRVTLRRDFGGIRAEGRPASQPVQMTCSTSTACLRSDTTYVARPLPPKVMVRNSGDQRGW